jgi:hypothetical protein
MCLFAGRTHSYSVYRILCAIQRDGPVPYVFCSKTCIVASCLHLYHIILKIAVGANKYIYTRLQ